MKKIWLVLFLALASAARGADQTVTAMPTNSAPASADVVLSVDVSDTSQAASGTNKKLLLSGLGTFFTSTLSLQNFQGAVTDAQVPDNITVTGAGDVTAASAFGTDNLLIRSDGTGKGVQSTGITVDDSNNITGVTTLGATTTSTQTFSILDAVDQSHGLSFVVASNLTAAKTFTYTGAFNFGMTLTGDTNVTFPTSGTLATLADIGGSGGADSLTGTHASPSTTTPLSPTWTAGEHDIFYGATGTINLPAASGYAGKRLFVYNTGAFTITLAPTGSDLIVREGTVQAATQTFSLSSGAGNYVELLSDGARWITLVKNGTLTAGSLGPADPTILWWKMTDGSGTTVTAAAGPNGTTDASWQVGASGSGNSLGFNGTSQEAQTSSAITYGTSSITVMAWVYCANWNDASENVIWESGPNYGSGPIRFIFGVQADVVSANIYMSGGGRSENFIASTTSTVANTWYHFAIVYENDANSGAGEITIYKNGSAVTTTVAINTKSGTGNFATEVLNLGSRNAASAWLEGRVDDLRVYNTALSAGDIATIYAAGSQ